MYVLFIHCEIDLIFGGLLMGLCCTNWTQPLSAILRDKGMSDYHGQHRTVKLEHVNWSNHWKFFESHGSSRGKLSDTFVRMAREAFVLQHCAQWCSLLSWPHEVINCAETYTVLQGKKENTLICSRLSLKIQSMCPPRYCSPFPLGAMAVVMITSRVITEFILSSRGRAKLMW